MRVQERISEPILNKILKTIMPKKPTKKTNPYNRLDEDILRIYPWEVVAVPLKIRN